MQALQSSWLYLLQFLRGAHEKDPQLSDRERLGVGWNRVGVAHFVWNNPAPSVVDHLSDGSSTLHSNNVEERRSRMKKAQDVAGRIIALFLTNALGVITGASVIAPELELWKAAALAGAVSVFKVVESLARASVDGKLTADEIDAAFGATPKKIAAKKAAK